METMFVKPSEEHVRNHSVAYWDNNPAHEQANPDWQQWGGAFIVGISESPDAIYEVADTPEVHIAIRQKRLVDVTKEVFESVLNDDLDTDKNPEQDKNEIISTNENNVFNESGDFLPDVVASEIANRIREAYENGETVELNEAEFAAMDSEIEDAFKGLAENLAELQADEALTDLQLPKVVEVVPTPKPRGRPKKDK